MDNILIVEDEEYIREFISINLKRNNFCPFEAETGEIALDILRNNWIDLVLLDLKLPGIDGYGVCKEIRTRYPNMAIIMVTAKGQDMDKILGLELGADDYLTKPFNPYELIARIRTVLRRTKNNFDLNNDLLIDGNLKIDFINRKILKGKIEVKLTPKEFEIVYILARQPGCTFTRDNLINSVWGEDYFGDTKTLDVHIRRLRGKIEDNPAEPVYIETVWGVGYRWKGVK